MTDTPENETADPVVGAAGCAQNTTESNGFPAYSYRDYIVDRTGELLESSVQTAEKFLRPTVGTLHDPRDGTAAHVLISKENGIVGIHPAIFDEYRTKPIRRTGTAMHTRVESLVAAIERFKNGDSAIFAVDRAESPSVTVVFDYHPATGDVGDADFGAHRARYNFPLSPEWHAWFSNNGKAMSMGDFARFLEDRVVDVLAEPGDLSPEAQRFVAATSKRFATPTALVELSRGLQIHEASVLKEVRNLSSGEGEFRFESQHVDADGKPVKLPNMFVIAIPVFARADVAYRMIARLSYRKKNDGLVFWYDLWRPDLVFTDAFEEAVNRIGNLTGLPVFYGTPE